jgi:hypothetical protein
MVHRLKNKLTDVPLKFSNFIKNEKETVKMLICGSEKQLRTDTKRTWPTPLNIKMTTN